MEFGSDYVFLSSKEEFEDVDELSLERGLLSATQTSSAANDDGEVSGKRLHSKRVCSCS